jgi:hypothetical protein
MEPGAGQESMGDAALLSHCSFAKKFLTKTNWGAESLS